MSTSNLFIPRRINVGFQNRTGTYTGKLAYIIYFDEKGKLRKETSWESWRDKNIPNVEYDNEPLEGFVLNKKVGGYCNDWSNFRQAYVRVYDPRGFEFEITVQNLLYILENTNSIKGKGLDGKFVYGWDGTDLVLVPSGSPDYEQLMQLNETRFERKKIYSKDLKIGATYLKANGDKVVYLGKYDYYDQIYSFDGKAFETYRQMAKYADEVGKALHKDAGTYDRWRSVKPAYDCKAGTVCQRHFFSKLSDRSIFAVKSISGVLIDTISEDCVSDYAERFEELERNTMFSPVDETKNENIYYDFEAFRKRAETALWGATFQVEYGSLKTIVEVCKRENEKYILRRREYDKPDLSNEFPRETIGGVNRMIPVTLDKIFEKFKFYYTNVYLANGKFHRRAY